MNTFVLLSEVTKIITRGITPKYADKKGVRVVNQKCIRNFNYNQNLTRLTAENTKIPETKLLQVGDTLINSTGTGTLGRTAYIKKLDTKTTVDTHITIARPNQKFFHDI